MTITISSPSSHIPSLISNSPQRTNRIKVNPRCHGTELVSPDSILQHVKSLNSERKSIAPGVAGQPGPERCLSSYTDQTELAQVPGCFMLVEAVLFQSTSLRTGHCSVAVLLSTLGESKRVASPRSIRDSTSIVPMLD